MDSLTSVLLYLIVGPIVGGLIAGIDRKVSARMQGRVGPSILQPFYDVFKLFSKESIAVNSIQNFFILCFLIFIIFTGCLFFMGGDILLVIFALTLASIFMVLGAYCANSPYSSIGAMRELLQMMAYEPMVLLTAIGFYIVTKSFNVSDIINHGTPMVLYLPGIFAGFIYILTMKLRKSPFDLSMSHHAHQEVVKGITTEFSGSTLAMIEIAHWYENIFLLGFVFMFFAWNNPISYAVAIGACILLYLFEIVIDNASARVKWQLAFNSSWIAAAALGFVNLLILFLMK
ncbi:MAG: NADH-quinone oxidoreductase subunit H [Clostridia bacterium]|nr:NADH-quinone oxidoreductase subunit H [Clostridia bacterium]